MNVELELNKRQSESQQKYIYFLLTAVGACIGFAITQTTNTSLTWSKLPLGIALILWAVSFDLGCRGLRVRDLATQANIRLLKLSAGKDPYAQNIQELISYGSQTIVSQLDAYAEKSSAFYKWQLRTLQLGVFSYVSWHVYEMSLRVH